MKNLKEDLIKFKIDTVDKLLDYFIVYYEYSFSPSIFKGKKTNIKKLFLGFTKDFHIKSEVDFERLWYFLILKYYLFIMEKSSFSFIKTSINKTLNEINCIDMEILKIQTEIFNKTIFEEGFDGLIERPLKLINEYENSVFNKMKYSLEDVFNFISKNIEYLSEKKVDKLRILVNSNTVNYINTEIVAVELWALFIQNYYKNNIYPKLNEDINKSIEKKEGKFKENVEKGTINLIDRNEIKDLTIQIIEYLFKKTKLKKETFTILLNDLFEININTIKKMLNS